MLKDDYIKQIEKEIKYTFKNYELLITALTHSSFANEANIESYERFEFLGDSILNFVVSEFLLQSYRHLNEGRLSKIRAFLVNQDAVASAVKDFVFIKHIKVVEGLEIGNPIIADVSEAIIGAVFLDSGKYDTAKTVVHCLLSKSLKTDFNKDIITDHKSYILEKCKADKKEVHFTHFQQSDKMNPSFRADLYVNNEFICSGYGRTKKKAEQMASKEAIHKLDER